MLATVSSKTAVVAATAPRASGLCSSVEGAWGGLQRLASLLAPFSFLMLVDRRGQMQYGHPCSTEERRPDLDIAFVRRSSPGSRSSSARPAASLVIVPRRVPASFSPNPADSAMSRGGSPLQIDGSERYQSFSSARRSRSCVASHSVGQHSRAAATAVWLAGSRGRRT